MARKRIHELSREWNVDAKDLIAKLEKIGVHGKRSQSSLTDDEVERLRVEHGAEEKPAVTVGSAHHGNLDALIAQSGDTSGPFSFDRGPPFELEAELAKEINRPSEVIDDDSYVVHPFECHVSNLHLVI